MFSRNVLVPLNGIEKQQQQQHPTQMEPLRGT